MIYYLMKIRMIPSHIRQYFFLNINLDYEVILKQVGSIFYLL